MIRKKINILMSILFLISCLSLISCDSTSFVYLDEGRFQRRVSHLKDAYVEIVYQIDPIKAKGYEGLSSPSPEIKENRFTEKNQISDKLIAFVYRIIKRNKIYTGKGWYPTFKIFTKHKKHFLYLFTSDEYMTFMFDFKNSQIFTNGRRYSFTIEEGALLKKGLDELLDMKREQV